MGHPKKLIINKINKKECVAYYKKPCRRRIMTIQEDNVILMKPTDPSLLVSNKIYNESELHFNNNDENLPSDVNEPRLHIIRTRKKIDENIENSKNGAYPLFFDTKIAISQRVLGVETIPCIFGK